MHPEIEFNTGLNDNDIKQLLASLREANDKIPGTAWMCDTMLQAADVIEALYAFAVDN